MNAPLIPQANPGAAFRSRRDALLKAAADVLDGGWYINGKQVRQFEESFAAFCSVKHAVGVGNGTDAIEVALRALGIGKGGLVFTVSHTAVATVAAIECAGATPVLVDVDPVTYTMSPESLAKALRPLSGQTRRRAAGPPLRMLRRSGCDPRRRGGPATHRRLRTGPRRGL